MGQARPADSLASSLLCWLPLSVAWELIKMSQRIMMSGARITLQEGWLLGQEGGYLSNKMGHLCRAEAQPHGKSMGFGVTLPGWEF